MAGDARVAAVRHFNRFYTQRIGVLHEGLLASPYSLAEVRVLYELAHRTRLTARDLAHELALDSGYLSRILRTFEKRGLVRRETASEDARRRPLSLTPAGRRTFAPLDRASQKEVAAMLASLSASDQARIAGSMQTIEHLLAPSAAEAPFVLRTHRPGDMGWVIQAHGELYWREYGWDERFEALVAHIAAEFIEKFDPQRERCWIAERDGERVGSVFLVRKSTTVAKLRLLIVDPKARGLGLGKHLVAECVRFARACGYRRVTLWTQENLLAARHIYEQAGFTRSTKESHAMFGVPLIGETWDLDLVRPRLP
jgi:DNA-binding MarR family transcriptional regulator/N-acetylglutamate synthase-like GNAT family acetyltransferase